MTNLEREEIKALARKAKTLREIWLRERLERLALEEADNAEIRRRWNGSKVSTEEGEARQLPRSKKS